MDNQNAEQQKHNALRRRLLQASTVAPVVATLTPSSALALSSATQCVNAATIATSVPGTATDTAVRQTVDHWVKHSGPANFPHNVYLVDGRLYSETGTDYPYNQQNQARLAQYYTKGTASVVCLFDVSGGDAVLRGLWPKVQLDDMHATPLTGSCWTSLTGMTSSSHGL